MMDDVIKLLYRTKISYILYFGAISNIPGCRLSGFDANITVLDALLSHLPSIKQQKGDK